MKPLQSLALFSLLLLASSASAANPDPIEVKLADGREGKCFEIEKRELTEVTPFRCYFGGAEAMLFRQKTPIRPHRGGSPLVAQLPEYEWTVIGSGKKMTGLQTLVVKEIQEKGNPAVQIAQGYYGNPVAESVDQPMPSLSQQSRSLSTVEQALQILAGKEPTLFQAGELENFHTRVRGEITARKSAIEMKFTDRSQTVVRLTNGQTTRCTRGASPVPQPSFTDFTGRKKEIACILWLCEEITVEGKTYAPLFLQDDEPSGFGQPLLMLGSTSGLGPMLSIEATEIQTAEGVENTYTKSKSLSFAAYGSPIGGTPAVIEPKFSKKKLEASRGTYDYLSNPMSSMGLKSARTFCDDKKITKALDRLEQATEKTTNEIVRVKTVELLDLVPGMNQPTVTVGEIVSKTIEKKLLPAGSCRLTNGVYYRPALEPRLDEIKKTMSEPAQFGLSEEEAAALFKEIVAMPDIPFRFTQDGCYARAHVITHRLKERGIDPEKIWAFGNLFPKSVKDLRWRYHVAPVIPVTGRDGKVRRVVIDPALADRPLEVSEWLKTFSPQGKKQWMEATFPPPWDAGSRGKIAVSFTKPEIYWPTLVPKDAESSLNQANETNANYKRVLETPANTMPTNPLPAPSTRN